MPRNSPLYFPFKIPAAILLIAVSIKLVGCNSIYDTFRLGGANSVNNASQETSTPVVINYALLNSQIFAPICLRCHSKAAGNQGGINLETYTTVKQNLSNVQSVIATNFMPLNGPPLSQALKNLLNAWIVNGAPQSEGPLLDEELSSKISPEVYFQTESPPEYLTPPQ